MRRRLKRSRGGAGLGARTTAGLALGLGLGLGCSSLEPVPPSKGCAGDEDCTVDGEACFNGRCSLGDTPPLPRIAFEIQERSNGATPLLRVQLRGCDRLVTPVDNEPGVLAVQRGDVVQTFEFQVHAHPEVDASDLQPDDLLAATLDITQGDRLDRAQNPVRRTVDHAPDLLDPDGNPLEEVATFVEWARYFPFDSDPPPAHVVWETRPTDLPPVVRMFRPFQFDFDSTCSTHAECCADDGCESFPRYCMTPPGEAVNRCTLGSPVSFIQTYVYDGQCARGLSGQVQTIDLEPESPTTASVPDAGVRLRYADAPDTLPLAVFDSNDIPLADRPTMCATDDDCGASDLACDVGTSQCVLRLAGRTADNGSTTDADGRFTTRVYTYCEGSDPSMSLSRAYTVVVSPPGPRPSVSYDLAAEFSPASLQNPPLPIDGLLCVPEWGQDATLAGPVALPLVGASRDLVAGAGDRLRCCDVGCLPATSEDFDPSAEIDAPTTCRGRTSGGVPPAIRLETTFTLDDAERDAWLGEGCLPPVQGVIGRLAPAVDCSGEDACTITEDLAWGTDDAERRYDLRIESPVGSVLASRILTLALPADPLDGTGPVLEPIQLGPRVLVRGTVTVDDETCAAREDPSDCTSKGAVVIAERLAMPALGDDAAETNANVPGPYFHQVTTFFDPVAMRDGAYVMPLDPGGVYVMTALPAAGEDGGPAAYAIVDLRDQTQATRDFVLEAGLLVTLSLDTFDRRSSVIPLDTGSEAGLAHPGRVESGEADPGLDLGRVGECLTPSTEAARGCRIRHLTPPGSNLTLSQVGITRFKARAPQEGEGGSCGG